MARHAGGGEHRDPLRRRVDIARANWRTILTIATVAMLLQQAFSYVSQITVPILADRVAEHFGISRAWLGLFLFLQNLVAIAAAAGCGGFILRYGPLRVSQVALFVMATCLICIASGWLWLYPVAALLLGISAVSTPASSHILARVCPPRLAPLVFSVKQTGVPVGSLIGGLLVPFLLGFVFYSATAGTSVRLGTFGTAIVVALLVCAVGLALQPLREHFDRERQPDMRLSVSDLPATLRLVFGNPPLRDLAFGAFAFGGLQSIFAGFFILYLIDGLDYTETQAGTAFAVASFSAVWARIVWGWLGSGVMSPRALLSGIGLVGAGAAIAMAAVDTTWSITAITSLAILYNMSALSWHGVLIAETARLSPPDQVGGTTGGVLAFTAIAMMIYPAIFGGILAVTDSYRAGFVAGSFPSLLAFIIFARRPVPGSWGAAGMQALHERLTLGNVLTVGAIAATGIGLGVLTSLP
jgi:MFS family permease